MEELKPKQIDLIVKQYIGKPEKIRDLFLAYYYTAEENKILKGKIENDNQTHGGNASKCG